MLSILLAVGMAPFYVRVCQELAESPDAALLDSLKNANRQDLARLDEAVRDAEENLGDVEQREALLARAEYLSGIGDKVRVSQALWVVVGWRRYAGTAAFSVCRKSRKQLFAVPLIRLSRWGSDLTSCSTRFDWVSFLGTTALSRVT